MFATNSNITQKVKTEVELVLTDGTVLSGVMFMHAEQRVLDIVNDDRKFVPFASFDGPVRVINKAVIAHITPLERDNKLRPRDAVRSLAHS